MSNNTVHIVMVSAGSWVLQDWELYPSRAFINLTDAEAFVNKRKIEIEEERRFKELYEDDELDGDWEYSFSIRSVPLN